VRARWSTWASSTASSASPALGTPTRATSSARARRTPGLPADNPDLADEIEKRIKEKLGVGAVVDADEIAPVPVDL
jgi:hypothetical protein